MIDASEIIVREDNNSSVYVAYDNMACIDLNSYMYLRKEV